MKIKFYLSLFPPSESGQLLLLVHCPPAGPFRPLLRAVPGPDARLAAGLGHICHVLLIPSGELDHRPAAAQPLQQRPLSAEL